jgi:hypothetical protein
MVRLHGGEKSCKFRGSNRRVEEITAWRGKMWNRTGGKKESRGYD